jgi:hypothetical protein
MIDDDDDDGDGDGDGIVATIADCIERPSQ